MLQSPPDASTTVFHPVVLPGVRFMTARGWNFPWRKISAGLELTLLERGASDWRLGRWNATRTPGSLSVINAGRLAVGTKIHAPGDFFGIEIEPALLGEERFDDAQIDDGPAVEEAMTLARLVRAHAEAIAIESSLWSLLALLRQADVGEPQRLPDAHRAAQQMRDLLHARYSEALSLDDLVQGTNVSRSHGLRQFRAAYGVTPFEYLMHVRLERAAESLRRGVRPSLVAAQTGFADQAHLTRWFVRMFRVTPGAFARAYG